MLRYLVIPEDPEHSSHSHAILKKKPNWQVFKRHFPVHAFFDEMVNPINPYQSILIHCLITMFNVDLSYFATLTWGWSYYPPAIKHGWKNHHHKILPATNLPCLCRGFPAMFDELVRTPACLLFRAWCVIPKKIRCSPGKNDSRDEGWSNAL